MNALFFQPVVSPKSDYGLHGLGTDARLHHEIAIGVQELSTPNPHKNAHLLFSEIPCGQLLVRTFGQ